VQELRGAGGTFFMLDQLQPDADALWGGEEPQGSVLSCDFYNAGAVLASLPPPPLPRTNRTHISPHTAWCGAPRGLSAPPPSLRTNRRVPPPPAVSAPGHEQVATLSDADIVALLKEKLLPSAYPDFNKVPLLFGSREIRV